MKKVVYIILMVLLLGSCQNQNKYEQVIARADSLMESNQDSARAALVMLDSLKSHEATMSEHDWMYYQLIYAKGMNKGFVDFTTDSVMKQVVAYYDKHGSANDRMLAYYLLGCAYRDLKDSPASLDSYSKAVESADTTSNECDYALLGRIHCSMGILYSKQRSPLLSIKEERLAEKYGWKAKDTLLAMWAYEKQVSGYSIVNNLDSVLGISLKAYNFSKENGLSYSMYNALNPIIDVYLKRRDFVKAGYYLHILQNSPSHFISPNQVQKGRELLYYTLGRYYCGIGKVDEAIRCFGEILTADNVTFSHLEAAYGGLHTAYQLKGNADSIAKYSQLYVDANDSSYVHSAIESMHKIQDMYDYQRYQRNALVIQMQNERLKFWGVFCGFIIAAMVGMLIVKIKKNKRKEKKNLVELNIKYIHAVDAFNCASGDLEQLKNDFKQYKSAKEKELEQLKIVLSQFNDGDLVMNSWAQEKEVLHCDLVKHFHQQAQVPNCMVTDDEWKCLKNLVKNQMPVFWNFLEKESKQLTYNEIQISLLCKLHFIPSEMALLMGMGVQQISNVRARINKKLFHKSGAKGLDANLRRIK